MMVTYVCALATAMVLLGTFFSTAGIGSLPDQKKLPSMFSPLTFLLPCTSGCGVPSCRTLMAWIMQLTIEAPSVKFMKRFRDERIFDQIAKSPCTI